LRLFAEGDRTALRAGRHSRADRLGGSRNAIRHSAERALWCGGRSSGTETTSVGPHRWARSVMTRSPSASSRVRWINSTKASHCFELSTVITIGNRPSLKEIVPVRHSSFWRKDLSELMAMIYEAVLSAVTAPPWRPEPKPPIRPPTTAPVLLRDAADLNQPTWVQLHDKPGWQHGLHQLPVKSSLRGDPFRHDSLRNRAA